MTFAWLAAELRPAGSPSGTLNTVRRLDDSEVQRISRARAITSVMSGDFLAEPLQREFEALTAATAEVFATSDMPRDRSLHDGWERALDAYLRTFVAMPRRIERAVDGALGEGHGLLAKAEFHRLHSEEPHFRLVWEWRNAAEHHAPPLVPTVFTAKLGPNGESQATWTLDAERARKYPPFKKLVFQQLLASNPSCMEVIKVATTSFATALVPVVLGSEQIVSEEALWLLSLAGEVRDAVIEDGHGPGAVTPVLLESTRDVDRLTFQVLDPLAAARALGTIDTARTTVGLPRLYSPPN